MKKIFLPVFLLALIITGDTTEASQNKKNIALIEEDKLFWDTVLNEKFINNKNLLYASYIAYKDRLNDLSIETFQECIKTNQTNNIIVGISNYYIGKNLFLIGKYEDAITQLSVVINYDLAKFNYIKFAAFLNIAISYYNLGNNEKCRENLQKVIESDTGTYKKQALDLISAVQ
ncbi:MAG: tetratricopeptide repeat protein [Spirochaetota bacterium]